MATVTVAEDGTAERSERLVTGYTGRLLLSISIGWMFIQTGRLLISPLLPAISADLGLSSTRAGFAVTVLWGLYALFQYPSGRLSDQMSRKTLLIGGLFLFASGFVVVSSAPTYLVFLAGAVIVGTGAGLYPTPARGLVSDLFVSRRGQAFGLHTASGDFGGVLAAILATAVVGVATWRAGFPPVIVVVLAIALSLHFWSREEYVLAPVELAVGTTVRRLFENSQLRWLLLAYTLYAFSWQAATGFLPTYLQVSKGFSPVVANIGFGALFVVGVLVKPVSGGAGDRFSRRFLAAVLLAIAGAMLTVVIVATTTILVIAAVVGFAAGLMAYPPVMQAYLMDSFPTDSMGGDLGAMRTVYIGLGALGPTYVGVVADVLDFRIAFAGLVASLFFSSLVIFTRGRQ